MVGRTTNYRKHYFSGVDFLSFIQRWNGVHLLDNNEEDVIQFESIEVYATTFWLLRFTILTILNLDKTVLRLYEYYQCSFNDKVFIQIRLKEFPR